MFSSSARLVMLLLLLASTCSSAAGQRDAKLRLLLHRNPKQEMPPRSSLTDLLLSDILQNEALQEDEQNFPLAEGEPEEIRLDLERAAASGPLLAPRERKAGCKNFFWKTFTSC